MKIPIDLPLVDGYIYTGEYRTAMRGEFVLVPDSYPPQVKQISSSGFEDTFVRCHIMTPVDPIRNTAPNEWQLSPAYPKITQETVYGRRPGNEQIPSGYTVIEFSPIEQYRERDGLFYLSTNGKIYPTKSKPVFDATPNELVLNPRLILRK